MILIAGNPNSGKTTLFNALTGLALKVGNHPGVTVERVAGTTTVPDLGEVSVVDLPGAYSLRSQSEDERVARNVLLGLDGQSPKPTAVIAVVNAAQLERSLFLVSQLLEVGQPMVLALNQVDVLEDRGHPVDAETLEKELGIPVVPVVARTGRGIPELLDAINRATNPCRVVPLKPAIQKALVPLEALVKKNDLVPECAASGEAIRLLTYAGPHDRFLNRLGDEGVALVERLRKDLGENGTNHETVDAEMRYAWARGVAAKALPKGTLPDPGPSERADHILTHRFLGPLIFVAIMGFLFQSVYTWAAPFSDLIESGVSALGAWVGTLLPEGVFRDLIVDGVFVGVGAVLVFLPQICMLFFLLTLLEDCGYLSRATFLVDRLMRSVGLPGKSFVPLMSSFACAIPGIMATRTIESRRDRMVTILVSPFMSCSARLPVYALLIAAFVPHGLQGLTLLGLYLLSIVGGLAAAWILRRTLFKGIESSFVMELPDYRRPLLSHVLLSVARRGWVFIRQAGGIILAISIVLWALAYFPQNQELEAQAQSRIEAGEDPEEVRLWQRGAQAEQSYAGRLGKAIEPAIEPLGFDWKVGVGLVASFAAREVMNSALAIVYNVGEEDDEGLRERLQHARRPDGTPAFNTWTAISLMVFFVFASQCMSTLAVVKRETNSWRWPLFMFCFMTAIAWIASFITYQGGTRLFGDF